MSGQETAGAQLFGQLAELLAPPGAARASGLVLLEPSGKDVAAAGAGTPAAAEALADLANTVPGAGATFVDTGGTYDDIWDFVLQSARPAGSGADPAGVTVTTLVNDNRADFELMARARVDAPGDVYHPVQAEPSDWLSEDGWTSASFRLGGQDPDPAPAPDPRITVPRELPALQWRLIEAREDTQLHPVWEEPNPRTKFQLLSYGADSSVGDVVDFLQPDRAADVLAKVAPATDTASGFELSFQYRVIGLQRPWLRAHLCQLSGWTIPGLPAGGLSNGLPEDNHGLLPVLTTRMLVVRNLVAKAHWSDSDRTRVASAETLALGPFTLSGAEGFDGSELSRPAPQVVAWLATVLPACPPPGEAGDGDDGPAGVGRVVSRTSLTVRSLPSTQSAAIGSLDPGQTVAIACKAPGQDVEGVSLWYRLGQEPAGWATARYIDSLGPVPSCPTP